MYGSCQGEEPAMRMRSCSCGLALGLCVLLVGADSAAAERAVSDKKRRTEPAAQPLWNVFKQGSARSVRWRWWPRNPRFAIYDAGTRYDSSDDMVWDKETNLVWERTPGSEVREWWQAGNHCLADTVTGGRFGWRQPSLEEFATLLDPGESFPPLPAGHPFENVRLASYFTATIINGREYLTPTGAPDVWVVDFGSPDAVRDGTIHGRWPSADAYVWCVRGGPGRQDESPAGRYGVIDP